MEMAEAMRRLQKAGAHGADALAVLRAAAAGAKEENERLRDATQRLADEEETP